MTRTAFASLAFATLALALAACGDDDGGGYSRPDSGVTIRPDAAVDASTDEPDADVGEPDADIGEPDAMPAEARLVLSEIVDGDLSGGLPKFAEITNTGGAAADLTAYSIGIFNNDSTTLSGPGQTSFLLVGTLEPGDSHVVAFDQSGGNGATYEMVYGEPPDQLITLVSPNGNDTIVLFEGLATGDGSDATVVDLYGMIGTDGEGTDWEYTDSYAVRAPDAVEPSQTWEAGDWQVNAPGTLDGLDAAGHDSATSPGVHSFEK